MSKQDTKWTSGNELKYLKEVLSNTNETKANPFTNRLEKSFANRYNKKYCIALNSGTSALHAALHSIGIKPGDEVITTPFTVLVDSSIIHMMGAIPVFADINYHKHNISAASVAELITDKTKAIIPVSYHGLPYEIDPIMELAEDNDLMVIEDDAQAFDAKYRNRFITQDADMSMISLERTKHISCGEGGVLLTDNEVLAEKARKFGGMGFKNLKAGGSAMPSVTPLSFQVPGFKRHDAIGLNYRLPESCAAIALAQLERGDEIVKSRRDVAKLYDNVFQNIPINIFSPQAIPEHSISSYFTYAVKTHMDRKEWIKFHDEHVQRGGDDFYAGHELAYREPIFIDLGYYDKWKGKCPNAEGLQPGIMQFKTNYRDLETAEKYIRILKESVDKYVQSKR